MRSNPVALPRPPRAWAGLGARGQGGRAGWLGLGRNAGSAASQEGRDESRWQGICTAGDISITIILESAGWSM